MKRSRAMRMAGVALAAGIVFLWVDASRGADGAQVVEVRLYAWPEGPGPVVAARSPEAGLYVPLANIQSAVPTSLPWRFPSWPCAAGGNVELTLRDGRVITYGPCGVPASIEVLRSTLATDAQRHGTRVDH